MKPRNIKTDIHYNGTDANIHLSDMISDFEYNDATEESDSISLTINDPDPKWLASWMPESGDKIHAGIILENWEGEGQELGFYCGEFIVDSFRLSAHPQKLVIEGVSSPVNLDFKETKRTQTWEKVTIRQIAAEISNRYGLALFYDTATDILLEREEQNEKTDSAYLKEICNKYGLGIKVYASQIVIWSYEEYESQPSTLTIRPEMLKRWTYKGSIQGTYTGAKVSYTDPRQDNTIEAFIGSEGRILNVNEKAENIADAEQIGKNALRNANRKEITMDITITSSISIVASNTVQVEGFGKIDGTYFVSRVSHRLSKKDYSVQLSLYRISASEKQKESEKEKPKETTNYVVKKGDTLWNLAKAFYQDATKYTVIYKANCDTIETEARKHGKKDSDQGSWLYPGTELLIP